MRCDFGYKLSIKFYLFRGKTHLSIDLFGDNLDFVLIESVVFSEDGGLRLLPKRNTLNFAVDFYLDENIVGF